MKRPRATPKFNLDNELKQGYHMEAINRIMKGANDEVNKKVQHTAKSAPSKVPVETQGALTVMSRPKIYRLYAGNIFDRPFETQAAFNRAFNQLLEKEGVIDIGDAKFMSQKYLKDHGTDIDITKPTMLPPDTPPKKLKVIESEAQDLSDYENEQPPKRREISDIFIDMRSGSSAYVKISKQGEVKHITAKDAGIAAGFSKGTSSYKIGQKYDEKGHIKSKDGSLFMRRQTKENEFIDIVNSQPDFKEFHTGSTFDMDDDAIEEGEAIEGGAEETSFSDEEEEIPLTISPTKSHAERRAEFAKKYAEENET